MKELFEKIKEQNLSKDKLENYHTELTYLYTKLQFELADLEKKEAIFLDSSEEKTLAGAKRKWDSLTEGQREIELKRMIKSTEKMLSSLKNRLYTTY
jgi:hypothetical protein